jgi:1-acyl-sn-glycerol-3-phosphate acyltransferase
MSAPNLYAPVRLICLGILKIVWRLEVTGTENVPKDGALIVACNHVSNLDPVALGCAMPRPVRYMAKRQLFAMPILGPLITSLQAYSVDREGSALAAMRVSLAVLKTGGIVGIFPEGRRNVTGEVKEKGGAALLASMGKVPVVPAAIVGTGNLWSFNRIRVTFGEPVLVERRRTPEGDDLDEWASRIMARITALKAALAVPGRR